MEGEV